MIRSNHTIAAAVLVFLFSLSTLVRLFIDFVNQGAFSQKADPWFVAMAFILFTILLVSSYGIWQNQRWGKIAAIIILTLNALIVLQAFLIGGTLVETMLRLLDIGAWLVVTVLLLWPTPQHNPA